MRHLKFNQFNQENKQLQNFNLIQYTTFQLFGRR